MKKPTLSQVIFSQKYNDDNIIVLMLSEASNSALFSVALDNTPFAFSIRLPRMRDEKDVTEWYDKLEEKDFDGLGFYEFSVSDLTGGEHTAIKTRNNTAKVIRRASPKPRADVREQLIAQFQNFDQWADEE